MFDRRSRYFEALRLPLLSGRTLRDTDTKTAAQAVVVNLAFARRYLKDSDAVGQHVQMGGQVRQIVGVVANTQQRGGFQSFAPVDVATAR